MGSWDMYLVYEEWEKKFKNEIKDLRKDIEYHKTRGMKRPTKRRKLAYNGILLTQLTNGARKSEAIEAVLNFMADQQKRHKQVAEAKKRRANKKNRFVYIPDSLKQADFVILRDMKSEQIGFNVWLYAHNRYGINTHSLRYAWVSYQDRQGVSTSRIAHYIRHSNIGQIEHYTKDQDADDYFLGEN